MSTPKEYRGLKVMPGSKLYDLLESKEQEDHKKAKKLADYLHEAYRIQYQQPEYSQLRAKYADVI